MQFGILRAISQCPLDRFSTKYFGETNRPNPKGIVSEHSLTHSLAYTRSAAHLLLRRGRKVVALDLRWTNTRFGYLPQWSRARTVAAIAERAAF
jgi:hypothetical protein